VKKPEHRWETRRFVAVPDPAAETTWRLGTPWEHDVRAERLLLRGADGRTASATVGLDHQRVDAAAAEDPDLTHAVMCWLVARGRRTIALHDDRDRPISVREFDVAELGDAVSGAGRVITLAPSNAELVDALDAFDRVVACEDSSDTPADVARCERLGPDLAPDLDRVAALEPSLVVSSLTVPGMERIVTGLRARGVPQVVSAPRGVAEVITDLQRLGAAMGVDAGPAVLRIHAEHDALRADPPAVPARVYLEWWPRPMYTPGRACFSNELVELGGGVNVFRDRDGSSIEITAEDLVAADPDACFVSWCGVAAHKLDPESVGRRPGLGALRAVREGRVFALDERFSGRPGPRMLETSRRIRAALGSAAAP
jgi:iron complex transport system substrate-binding protein